MMKTPAQWLSGWRLAWLAWLSRAALACLGGLGGLLAARLVLRLFAARPDHPLVAALLWFTDPIVGPLVALNARQPLFGAVLELSTLSLLVAVVVVIVVVRRAGVGVPRPPRGMLKK